jgi:hypothetical protein
MRLLLPAPEYPKALFYEINVSEEPASLAISGFDWRHRVVAQADVRPDGEFGLTSTQILRENAVTVRAALSATAGWLAVIEGTINEQPFEMVNTPSYKPQVVQAPDLSDPDAATLAHWQRVARGLVVLAQALRSYEPLDDPWGVSPCQLVLGAIAVGASSCLTADTDAGALDAYHAVVSAGHIWLTQGNCVQTAPPLSDLRPR